MKNCCPICGNTIVGRSDKKFCSSKCKNKYHRPSKNLKGDQIKMVNTFLYQNFQIMESIFTDEKKDKLMVPRILLDKMGFHYPYSTGCYVNNQKKIYRYIYNYAWMEFSDQRVMLIRSSSIHHK